MVKNKFSSNIIRMALFLGITFICMLAFVLIQPFGDGPDEINRYKIVQFIYTHGFLPIGSDPEVLIDGYGASYAFQPMLTYIIEGYLLHFLSFLLLPFKVQLIIARMVNVCFGLIMALYVRKLSVLLFKSEKASWAFTLAVVFLPQNLFIHTYVNTDSMGLLSIAMIIYAMVKGMKDNYALKTSIQLSIGIILCAIFMFILQFFVKKENSNHYTYDYTSLFKKGGLITLIVLLGIGWWFIRNAILYDGDFLALEARRICAAATGLENFNPLTADTYQSLGIPVLTMIFGTDYYTLVWKSFIAMFGPMLIPTHHYIYMAFKYWFIACLVGLILPVKSHIMEEYSKKERISFSLTMTAAMIIPAFLAIYYSYTWDFQPQGRYYLPLVIPFMFFLTIGILKLFHLLETMAGKINEKAEKMVSFLLFHFLYAFLTLSLLYSVFVAMLRYYKQ